MTVWRLYSENQEALFIPKSNFTHCKNFHMAESLTHVEGDGDDVQRHGGVCDAAE